MSVVAENQARTSYVELDDWGRDNVVRGDLQDLIARQPRRTFPALLFLAADSREAPEFPASLVSAAVRRAGVQDARAFLEEERAEQQRRKTRGRRGQAPSLPSPLPLGTTTAATAAAAGLRASGLLLAHND